MPGQVLTETYICWAWRSKACPCNHFFITESHPGLTAAMDMAFTGKLKFGLVRCYQIALRMEDVC